MLVDNPSILYPDLILSIIAAVNGNSPVSKQLRTGVYEIGHFGGAGFMDGYEEYPDLSIECYGVCDNVDQLIDQCPELKSKKRSFTITVTRVKKSNQPKEGGWRWHKWGPYIGTKSPQCEYLYDETDIEEVLCYHIYEQKEEKS